MEKETKETITWWSFVILVCVALVLLNLKISNLQKQVVIQEDNQLSNSEQNTLKFQMLADKFDQQLSSTQEKIADIQFYNYIRWFKEHKINLDQLDFEMDSLSSVCHFGDLGYDTLNYIGDERVGLRLNSTVGIINLFISNTSKITCQKDAFLDNETDCRQTCYVPPKNETNLSADSYSFEGAQ